MQLGGVSDMADSEARREQGPEQVHGGVRCDFCQAVVPAVRRVALDRDYERLRTPHREQFACPDCSAKKEKERQGGL